MEQMPEWLGNVLLVVMGSVSTMVVAVLGTRNKDRMEFTNQVMARLQQVEEAQRVEREYCEHKIAELRDGLRSRDETIVELRDRVQRLESGQQAED